MAKDTKADKSKTKKGVSADKLAKGHKRAPGLDKFKKDQAAGGAVVAEPPVEEPTPEPSVENLIEDVKEAGEEIGVDVQVEKSEPMPEDEVTTVVDDSPQEEKVTVKCLDNGSFRVGQAWYAISKGREAILPKHVAELFRKNKLVE